MKKITIFLALFYFLIYSAQISLSQTPTYDLMVRNMTLNSPTDNEIEFDIYIMRTGATAFEYAAGRYNFYFNPLIANGGSLLYTFVSGVSDLPPSLQPFGPSIVGDRLNMTINSFPGSGNGAIISNVFPGTRVCRMKLATTASVFALEHLALQWNNPGSLNPPRTVVYAYNLDGDEVNITTPPTHSIDSSGIGGVLPVELTNFAYNIFRNNVSLNWSTSSEINNSGFYIERKSRNTEWNNLGFVSGNGTVNNVSNYSFTDRNLESGYFSYRLKQVDFNGEYRYYNLGSEIIIGTPSEFSLSQNYPNPFNPSTKINYEIPVDAEVSLKLFDISGKEVFSLVNEFKTAGYYTVNFSGDKLSSGTYFYRLTTFDGLKQVSETKKMVLTK